MIRAASVHGYNGALSVEVFRDAYWAQPIAQINADAKRYLDLLMAQI
jgi:sugar phosphate isomerase/epimerase